MKLRQNNTILHSCGTISILAFIWLFAFILSSPLFIFNTQLTLSLDIHPNDLIQIEQEFTSPHESTNVTNNYLVNITNSFVSTMSAKDGDDISSFKIYHCVENWPYHQSRIIYSYAALLIQYIFPILIVGIAYGSIWWKLNSQRNKLRTHTRNDLTLMNAATFVGQEQHEQSACEQVNETAVSGTKDKKSSLAKPKLSYFQTRQKKTLKTENHRRRKMNILLSVIALIFAASWLPLNIFNILSDSKMSIIKADHTYYVINAICILLGMSSAVSNPVLYGVLNENFKREYAKLFSRFFSRLLVCSKPKPGADSSNHIAKGKSENELNPLKYSENKQLLFDNQTKNIVENNSHFK